MAGLAVVAGATGYLGGHVARAAKDAGWRVRALARDPARLGELAPLCDEVFVGEATQPESLDGLYDGADVAFSSIGVRSFRRRPTIWEVDAAANIALVDAAERAGVGRFVFVSLFQGPTRRARLPVAEARERVVDRLVAGSMPHSVLRPSGFFNDMEDFLQMARKGRVWVIGDGTNRFNPIHGADLAAECVACFDDEGDVARDVGGPEVFSLEEIARLACSAVGTLPRTGHVPAWLVRALGRAIYPFNNNAGAFLQMFAILGDGDLVAPQRGTHRLEPFLTERLAALET